MRIAALAFIIFVCVVVPAVVVGVVFGLRNPSPQPAPVAVPAPQNSTVPVPDGSIATDQNGNAMLVPGLPTPTAVSEPVATATVSAGKPSYTPGAAPPPPPRI